MKLELRRLHLPLYVLLLGIFVSSVASETIYCMLTHTRGFIQQYTDDEVQYYAVAGSRFKILTKVDNDLTIRFTHIPEFDSTIVDYPGYLPVLRHVNYIINTDILPDYNIEIAFGFDWGVLTIPIKLQLKDGNLTTGATLDVYAGWKKTFFHIPFTILAAAGPSAVPSLGKDADNVETELGWSYAVGITLEPISQFQIGIFLGADHVIGEAGERYEYQNKPWLSFGIGWNLI